MSSVETTPFRTHLEFLGYQVRDDGEALFAVHPSELNIIVKPGAGGALVTSYLGCTPEAKSDRTGVLGFVNDLNQRTLMAVFYLDRDSDLAISAFFVGDYERVNFGRFVEIWQHDTARLVEDQDRARKYLK